MHDVCISTVDGMSRPNFLVILADQLTGVLFPDLPADFLVTPHLRALGERAARFTAAYCPSPLCVPSRAALMSARLPSRSRVWDNAAEFVAEIPTFAHLLRRAGWQTSLAGKMHFVGPDQLHGFEERLTTDIYPADFGWTPNYDDPETGIEWWYHNLGSVTAAGTAEITNQLDFDDEVAHVAARKLHDLARGPDRRPWCLTVSFTHPHDPYVARPEHFALHDGSPALDPFVPAIPYETQDPHSRRLMRAYDHASTELTPEQIRRARQAYFGNVAYVDDRVGDLLRILDRTGMAENTVVVFASDHGDMLGERGLWFKMCFFEAAARVPLWIAVPGEIGRRIDTPVSTLDLLPTLADLAGVPLQQAVSDIDGESLMPLLHGEGTRGPVPMEYAAEGSAAPLVSLRDGRFKIVVCDLDPPLLYDLQADPNETKNLATDPAHRGTLERLLADVRRRWDLTRFDAEVRASQARRHLVWDALSRGHRHSWDHQPTRDASRSYMRNHMDLDILEEARRWPRSGAPSIAGSRNPAADPAENG